jgi:hypothetical protein
MKRHRLFVPALLVLAALVLSASGSAAIVPQHSIAGIKLNMSKKAVKAKLGAPLRVRSGSGEFGPWQELVYRRVRVSFLGGSKVMSVETQSKLERTATGIGVGSTLAQVRAGLQGERCKREFGIHHCWLGRWEPGRVITEFRFKKSRVTKVAVARVVD